MAILLFLLQLLVNSFVRAANGEGATIEGELVRPLVPPFILETADVESCFAYQQPPYDFSTFANTSCPGPNPLMPPLDLRFFVDSPSGVGPLGTPGCGAAGSGLLGAFPDDRPITRYPAKVFPDRGNFVTYCERKPLFSFPLNLSVMSEDFNVFQSNVFNNFRDLSYPGGYVFRAYDESSKSADASVYYNGTLGRQRNVPLLLGLLAEALMARLTGGNVTVTNLGAVDFPTADKENTFEDRKSVV